MSRANGFWEPSDFEGIEKLSTRFARVRPTFCLVGSDVTIDFGDEGQMPALFWMDMECPDPDRLSETHRDLVWAYDYGVGCLAQTTVQFRGRIEYSPMEGDRVRLVARPKVLETDAEAFAYCEIEVARYLPFEQLIHDSEVSKRNGEMWIKVEFAPANYRDLVLLRGYFGFGFMAIDRTTIFERERQRLLSLIESVR